jgi:hypothetical protein
MAKKKAEVETKADLDALFSKFPAKHSVSFEQLKEILVAIVGGYESNDEAVE